MHSVASEAVKTVKQRIDAGRGDAEDRPVVLGASLIGCSIELAVIALNQHSDGTVPVRGIPFESVEHGDLPGRRCLVNYPTLAGRISPALRGSVKVAVDGLRRKIGRGAISIIE